MTTIQNFSCTLCGKCCHDLRLPLSVEEAFHWSGNGNVLNVLCEAIPWPKEPEPTTALVTYKRDKSYAVTSGELPLRVIVTLVASFDGPCPHLQPDMTCGAYATRPRVCQIYPAEIHPFVKFDRQSKACPPQAWSDAGRPMLIDGRLVNSEAAALAARFRQADIRDVSRKSHLCARLGIFVAALSNEGFAVHSRSADEMNQVLSGVLELSESANIGSQEWVLMTNRSSTRAALDASGAWVVRYDDALPDGVGYLPFHADD